MHLLLAEDDERLAGLMMKMMKREAWTVDHVGDGTVAYDYASVTDYDVLILDWMLPGRDGIDVCRDLRADGYQGAILILTARTGTEERVTGLDSGADDYLEKPFEFKELFARVRALGRRSYFQYDTEKIQVLDLVIDTQERCVYRDSTVIDLTPREFQLLALFARNKNQVLSRGLILERVWGADHDVTDNTLDAYIRLLRKKLGESAGHDYIQTIRGTGYKLGGES